MNACQRGSWWRLKTASMTRRSDQQQWISLYNFCNISTFIFYIQLRSLQFLSPIWLRSLTNYSDHFLLHFKVWVHIFLLLEFFTGFLCGDGNGGWVAELGADGHCSDSNQHCRHQVLGEERRNSNLAYQWQYQCYAWSQSSLHYHYCCCQSQLPARSYVAQWQGKIGFILICVCCDFCALFFDSFPLV